MLPAHRTFSLLALGLCSLACSDSLTEPDRGTLVVIVTTTGEDLDPDGYVVTVGPEERALEANGSVSISLPQDAYVVELGDVAANCQVDGNSARPMTVVAGTTQSTEFEVLCTAIG